MNARLTVAALLAVAVITSAWSRNVDPAKKAEGSIAKKIEKSIQTLEKNHVRVPGALKRVESRWNEKNRGKPECQDIQNPRGLDFRGNQPGLAERRLGQPTQGRFHIPGSVLPVKHRGI